MTSPRACRLGVQLPEVERRVGWPELLAMATRAEEIGLDSIWLGDHLLYDLPDGSVRGPWEAWTSLAALAAHTQRVQLGTLVASLGFHPPAMLAKQAATVDAISGGRLVMGVGAGWNQREYDAFGFPFDRRVDRFEEAFGLLRRLLAGETVTAAGRYYAVDRCVIDPPPRAGGIPLMVGSVAPRMQAITLPHVAAWNIWFTLFGNTQEGFAAHVAQVRDACERLGRDPDDVEATAAVLVQAPFGAGRTQGDDGFGPVPPIMGTPDEVAEALHAFGEAGARHLQVVLDPITLEGLDWLGEVVAAYDA
jgi:probable F420-dependent oxidoreductase